MKILLILEKWHSVNVIHTNIINSEVGLSVTLWPSMNEILNPDSRYQGSKMGSFLQSTFNILNRGWEMYSRETYIKHRSVFKGINNITYLITCYVLKLVTSVFVQSWGIRWVKLPLLKIAAISKNNMTKVIIFKVSGNFLKNSGEVEKNITYLLNNLLGKTGLVFCKYL